MTERPAPSPARTRRRRRRQRIGIVVQLVIGAAAYWFISHPASFPRVRPPLPDAPTDSVPAVDSASIGDTAALAAPFSALPATPLPAVVARPRGRLFRSIEERARAGERIAVSVTAYCLQGRTRRGNTVREGIIAVDRALFPLGREVDLFFGRRTYGRFLADDTGGAIRGGRIDIWMSDCSAARRFGRRRGYAQLARPAQ